MTAILSCANFMFQHVLEIIYSFYFNVFPFTNIEHVFQLILYVPEEFIL